MPYPCFIAFAAGRPVVEQIRADVVLAGYNVSLQSAGRLRPQHVNAAHRRRSRWRRHRFLQQLAGPAPVLDEQLVNSSCPSRLKVIQPQTMRPPLLIFICLYFSHRNIARKKYSKHASKQINKQTKKLNYGIHMRITPNSEEKLNLTNLQWVNNTLVSFLYFPVFGVMR